MTQLLFSRWLSVGEKLKPGTYKTASEHAWTQVASLVLKSMRWQCLYLNLDTKKLAGLEIKPIYMKIHTFSSKGAFLSQGWDWWVAKLSLLQNLSMSVQNLFCNQRSNCNLHHGWSYRTCFLSVSACLLNILRTFKADGSISGLDVWTGNVKWKNISNLLFFIF